MPNEYQAGTASDEAIAAEAIAAGVPAPTLPGSTAVEPLTTADIAPKKVKAPKKAPAKKAAKKKGK